MIFFLGGGLSLSIFLQMLLIWAVKSSNLVKSFCFLLSKVYTSVSWSTILSEGHQILRSFTYVLIPARWSCISGSAISRGHYWRNVLSLETLDTTVPKEHYLFHAESSSAGETVPLLTKTPVGLWLWCFSKGLEGQVPLSLQELLLRKIWRDRSCGYFLC